MTSGQPTMRVEALKGANLGVFWGEYARILQSSPNGTTQRFHPSAPPTFVGVEAQSVSFAKFRRLTEKIDVWTEGGHGADGPN